MVTVWPTTAGLESITTEVVVGSSTACESTTEVLGAKFASPP
jgi:hypothetical protein